MKTLRLILLVAVALVLASAGLRAADTRPNFIVINIDDMGYADIGPFGSKLNRTPNLDRMAAEGCRLTSFYGAPVCSPSRASLMTGCYPKRVLPIPHVLFPVAQVGLSPDAPTVAELLKKAGYATACIGKWHLGDQPEFLPRRRGFDYYFGLPYSNDMGTAEDGSKSSLGDPLPVRKGKAAKQEKSAPAPTGVAGDDQPPLPLLENETVVLRVRAEEQQTLVSRYTEKAVAFIEANRSRPFFLYLPHNAVHFPWYPGKAYQGKSANGVYGDWVEEVDGSVGQILATLKRLKLADNTLVLFTSDNGGTPRAVNKPLRGFKGSTWEGGMREPSIVWWPGHVPAGTSSGAISGMIDVLPTLVKLAGGNLPANCKIDGADMWPIISGRPAAKPPHNDYFYYRGLRLEAVREGPWKLHLAKSELYNLDTDIGEAKNVAAAHPDIVKNLRALADATRDDLGLDGIGPGCRKLGRVANPLPLIGLDGKVRAGFDPR